MSRGLRKLIASKWLKLIGLTPFSSKGNKLKFKFQTNKHRPSEASVVIDRLGTSPYGVAFDGDQEKLRVEKEKNDLQWRFLAVVADRVFLIIHIVILSVNIGFFLFKFLI